MNTLNFSYNLLRLRREKGITQEELAEFVGVTKASVSKWETRQSMPDIMLLPQLAAFFDITIDELLGYERQLSKEQIQKIYRDLASDFADMPFEDVMEKSEAEVKRYYSCYRFLLQMAILWLNHFMLAEEQERQGQVLDKAAELCCHIAENSEDLSLCSDAAVLKGSIDLLRGKAQEVVEAVGGNMSFYRLPKQEESLLIQAYQAIGDTGKANSIAQTAMFAHLTALIGDATLYIAVNIDKPDICEETIRRIDDVIKIFKIEALHPNTAAVFNYQAAVFFCMHGQEKYAIERLSSYARITIELLSGENLRLHGDSYFDMLDEWFEDLDLGTDPVRDRKVILDGAVQAMDNPVFASISDGKEFKRIKEVLIEGGKYA